LIAEKSKTIYLQRYLSLLGFKPERTARSDRGTLIRKSMSSGSSPNQRSYWCFISYRHADNKAQGRQWATWLHQAIETYEVPRDLVGTVNERGEKIPERIFPVFRDEEELPVDADLALPIYRALDCSKLLVVICSPRSVASQYVNNEIYYFKQIEKKDLILALMIEGEPNARWDETKVGLGFDAEQECFPYALKHNVDQEGNWHPDTTEPIAADFRLGTGQGWTSLEAYRQELRKDSLEAKKIDDLIEDYRKQCELMKLKVIAGILGVPLGTLTQRDKAYQLALVQRRAKVLRRWLMAIGLLAVLAVAGGGVAYQQKMEADTQRKLAEQQKQIAQTNAQLANDEKKKAEDNAARAEAQRKIAVENLSQSDFYQGNSVLGEKKYSEALAYFARAVRGNPQNHAALARLYTLLVSQHSWQLPVAAIMKPADLLISAAFNPDGTRVLTVTSSEAQLWDAHTGQPVGEPMRHTFEQTIGSVRTSEIRMQALSAAFSPDGSKIMIIFSRSRGDPEKITLWDGHTAQFLGEVAQPSDRNQNVYLPGEIVQPQNNVLTAAFGPDGNPLIVGFSGSINLEATGGSANQTPKYAAVVNAANFAVPGPDGASLVTASTRYPPQVSKVTAGQDSMLQLQLQMRLGPGQHSEALDGAIRANLPNDVGWVNFAVFSPDGSMVVTGARDQAAQLWDARTAQPVGQPLQHDGLVVSAAFSADGKQVVTTSIDKTARLWDGHTGQSLGQPIRQNGLVYCAAFSPDGHAIVTGCADKTARMWDTATGQPIGEPMRHANSVTSVAFSPDGKTILTGSTDETARLWDARSGLPLATTLDHTGLVNSAVFSADGTRVVTASEDHTARLWNVSTGQPLGSPMQHGDAVKTAAFSPDGTRVVTASWDQTSQLWDAHSGQPLGQPMRNVGGVKSAVFSPDGKRVLSAGVSTAQLWDASSGAPIGEPMKPRGFIRSAAFSADGTRIATGIQYGDFSTQVWDGLTGQSLGQLQVKGFTNSAVFSSDGTRIVTATDLRAANIWDISGMPRVPLAAPRRKKVITDPRRVQQMLMQTHQEYGGRDVHNPLGETMVHEQEINSALFNPDGTEVVTASDDQTARLWDGHTGQPSGDPMVHDGPVVSAVFSPDGTRVLTASKDKTARLWDGVTGQPITEPLVHDDAVNSAVFSPDATWVLTTSKNSARLWDLLPPNDVPSPAWLPDLAEAVGGLQLSDSGSLIPADPEKFFDLRAQHINATGDDFWSKVGRWFFADRDTRTISPQSTMTIPEYRAKEAAAAPPPVPTTPPAQPSNTPPPSTPSPVTPPTAAH
jgi:WD40 repeat protein